MLIILLLNLSWTTPSETSQDEYDIPKNGNYHRLGTFTLQKFRVKKISDTRGMCKNLLTPKFRNVEHI